MQYQEQQERTAAGNGHFSLDQILPKPLPLRLTGGRTLPVAPIPAIELFDDIIPSLERAQNDAEWARVHVELVVLAARALNPALLPDDIRRAILLDDLRSPEFIADFGELCRVSGLRKSEAPNPAGGGGGLSAPTSDASSPSSADSMG